MLKPLKDNVLITELKEEELKEITGNVLIGVETNKLDVLNYGRVVQPTKEFEQGDVVLYQKLASHKTNYGKPRVVLVPADKIEGAIND